MGVVKLHANSVLHLHDLCVVHIRTHSVTAPKTTTTNKQTNKQTNEQTNKQASKQTNKQTNSPSSLVARLPCHRVWVLFEARRAALHACSVVGADGHVRTASASIDAGSSTMQRTRCAATLPRLRFLSVRSSHNMPMPQFTEAVPKVTEEIVPSGRRVGNGGGESAGASSASWSRFRISYATHQAAATRTKNQEPRTKNQETI